MLHTFALGTTLFLIAMLFGSMLFFAAIVTPAAFKSLDKEQTGRYLQILFPRYYLWGLIVAILATIDAKLISWAVAAPVACVAIGFWFTRQWLLPHIEQDRAPARSGDRKAQQRFKYLHGLSVLIHLTQMILLLAGFILAWRYR